MTTSRQLAPVQTELPFPLRIKTPTGSMALSSLRPGDYCFNSKYPRVRFCVLINSAKLERLVVRFYYTGDERLEHYRILVMEPAYRFYGQGSLRKWHALLPKFLQARVCPYSKP